MISAEDVRGLYAQRKNDRQAIIGQMTQVRDLYNADLAVPLPELDSNEKPAVTNLLKQGIDGTAQRITSTMPDVYFPAAKPGQTRSEQQAQVARRAVLGWWQRNDMNNIMARRARHFLGYSISPVVLRPDRTLRHARWEVRDPLTCYPAPSLLDNMTPANVIFAFTRGVDWLLRNHPIAAGALYLNNRDDKITILEYLDEIVPARRLYPGTPQERARIRRLAREDEEHLDRKCLTPIYDELYTKPAGTPPDEARLEDARRQLAGELDYFGRELRGAFLAGEAPTAADFVLYPDIAYVKRIGAKKPESKLAGILPPPIAQWAARIEALPYFEKTFPPHWRS